MFNVHNRDRIDSILADTLDKASAESKRRFLKEHNNDGTHRFTAADLVPIGGMVDWPTTTPPEKWLVCDGSQVSRTTYQGLFNAIGTTFGAGDGSTTFNLPDLRQRFVLYKAAAGTGSSIGATGGAIDHTHTGPAHTHTISSDGAHSHAVSSHTHSVPGHQHPFTTTTSTASGGGVTVEDVNLTGGVSVVGSGHVHSVDEFTDENDSFSTGAASPDTNSQGAHTHGGATGSGGSGDTGTNNPPYIVLNKIIFAGV